MPQACEASSKESLKAHCGKGFDQLVRLPHYGCVTPESSSSLCPIARYDSRRFSNRNELSKTASVLLFESFASSITRGKQHLKCGMMKSSLFK